MKNVLTAALAAALIAAPFTASQATAAPVKLATTAASPAKAAAPVMLDNLSKYGLKKDVELPVTVTAGGFSYTLEKIMIYDYNSPAAVALREKYKFVDGNGMVTNPKYFIWTKITITNKSQKIVKRGVPDLLYKWRLFFADTKGEAYDATPQTMLKVKNSKEALRNFTLNPGESLTTYQAYLYKGNLDYFLIFLEYGGSSLKYVANDPEQTE
ncbi:hypothetical protein [Paenibacillus glufosinatiresistens]|uniref:hypothetical protein n=1 Tax=Paenibacillus glufosinatiresistens TaxID=3070657 RepID=UPI00286E36EA|nr:hypothetical protein [Paenibacillus sp. YX.27]